MPTVIPYVVPAAAISKFSTAGDVINKTSAALGLSQYSDPYAATDTNVVQLRQLLENLGRELVGRHEWTYLTKEFVLTTVGGQSDYDLPEDFARWVDETQWNRSARLPLSAGMTGPEWQYVRAIGINPSYTLLWRPWKGVVSLLPPNGVPAGNVLVWEYRSRAWVQPVAEVAPTRDAPVASSDILWFDSRLLQTGLAYHWRSAKGMDADYWREQYEGGTTGGRGGALGQAIDDDVAGRTVSLACRPSAVPAMIGLNNIPPTGWGPP